MRYVLIIVATLLFINFFFVPMYEPGLIYFPAREIEQTPSYIGIKYEDIYLRAADGKMVNGWFIGNDASQKVILLFHGNGGNLSHRLPIIRLLHGLPASVFIIDYHGYGKSEGHPSEANLYLDARAAYDYLTGPRKYRPEQIIVMGSSLGGAVAAELAAGERVGGLVLLRTFTSASDMAKLINPLYRRPIVWIRSRYDTMASLEKIRVPVLIVHSKQDEMIPYAMAVKLYEKAGGPKKLILLEEGRHNDLYADPAYISELKRMLGAPSP